MKKIAFYVESMIGGGAERQLINLVNHLDHSKYEVWVIAIYEHSIYDLYTFKFDEQLNEHVKYKALVNNGNRFFWSLFNHAYAHLNKKWIYKLLLKEKFDIEIAFYEGFPTEFVSNSANKTSKKYAWLHTDNHRFYQNADELQLKKTTEIYKTFDEIIGVSKYVTESFLYYFPGFKTRVIYNGLVTDNIDCALQENCDFRRKEYCTFITVGRMNVVKGYGRLLAVLKKLKDEGYVFELIMIGDGEELPKYQKYVKENRMEDSIFFLGARNNPYVFMKKADYFISSSLFEGYGIAAMEAIYCELPVLATDCSVQKELFGGFQCGVICENSEEGIYRMLKDVFLFPEQKEKYIAECQKRKPSLNIEESVKQFDQLINGDS